jgi:hypothetical protein
VLRHAEALPRAKRVALRGLEIFTHHLADELGDGDLSP